MPRSGPEREKDEKILKTSQGTESIADKARHFVESAWNQVKSLNRDSIIYILLAVGLVLLIVQPLFGGIIIGAIAGLVFSNEIMSYAMQIKGAIEREEVLRGVVLGVVLLAFFLEAPSIVIGAALAVAIKRLVYS